MILQVPDEQLLDVCGEEPSWVCERVLDRTDGNEFLARSADFLVAKPLSIALILAVAYIVNRLVRRAIRRFAERVSEATSSHRSGGRLRAIKERTPSVLLPTGEVQVRSAARAQTIGLVLRSVASAFIYGIAVLLCFGELGVELAPLIAGAGIVGVALGFGAQSLVKDFLSGIFMLIEDQYGVGDIVNVGEATGTVEAVTLRSTRLRDVNGVVWHVPNGEIRRVGNHSQQWARALLDITVAYGTDVRAAEDVIRRVADGMWHDEAWRPLLLEEPEVWGVERLAPEGIDIRLVIKTKPSEQFKVMRELRTRINEALDAEGIKGPLAPTSVWVGQDGTSTASKAEPAPKRSPRTRKATAKRR